MHALLALALLAAQPLPSHRPTEPVLPTPAPSKPAHGGAEPGTTAAAPPAPTDGVEVLGWNAGAVRTPSSKEAWGGERKGDEPTLSERVANYDLKAVLDPVKHTVDGTERLTWHNRSDRPIRSLYFHLYLNAFESPASTFMTEKRRYGAFRSGVEIKKGEWGGIELRSITQGQKPATWTFVHPDGGPETDHTVVRVDLPEPVAPGATAELTLKFFDQLPRVMARTGYFDKYHLVGQWYPKIGVLEVAGERGATAPRWNVHEFHLNSEFYGDWGSYTLEVVAPDGYTVAASGVRQGAPEKAQGQVTHRFRADDVHDVAFTAWDGYAAPLTASWTGPGSPQVAVQVLYPPEYARAAREALQATLDSLTYFSQTLGPYPYPAVTCIVPPYNAAESGGMEYETFFTTDAGNSTFASTPGITRYVTVHEFGHGYFMGLLASNEFEEPFLDEGMNELWDTRMLGNERAQVRSPALLRALNVSLPPIDIWNFERGPGTSRYPPDSIAGNSWHRFSTGSYALVYARTVMVFHDLSKLIGEDVFARGMKLYYRRWHHRHPSTADLREALIDGGGDRKIVERWFEEQVFDARPVDDRIVELTTEELLPQAGPTWQDGKKVEVDEKDLKKELEERRKAFAKEHPDAKPDQPGPFPWRSVVRVRRYGIGVPQTVLVTFEDGKTETLQWPADQKWARFVFDRPVRIKSAQIDPEHNYLLDLSQLDNGHTREADHAASRKLSLDAAAVLQLALSFLEAL